MNGFYLPIRVSKCILTVEILVSFVVTISFGAHVDTCGSSGVIDEFPHCIGYWPPKFNPSIINSTKSKNTLYIPTMAAFVDDLKQNSVEQQHTIQVSILLPHNFTKDVSKNLDLHGLESLNNLAPAQKRSGIGTLIGFKTIREKNLIRNDILFNITLRDSKCDDTYGLKAFLDAFQDEVHVLFGPSCDYSLGKYSQVENSPEYLVLLALQYRWNMKY